MRRRVVLVLQADALIFTFLLNNMPAHQKSAARWEKEVFLPIVRSFKHPELVVSYMAEVRAPCPAAACSRSLCPHRDVCRASCVALSSAPCPTSWTS